MGSRGPAAHHSQRMCSALPLTPKPGPQCPRRLRNGKNGETVPSHCFLLLSHNGDWAKCYDLKVLVSGVPEKKVPGTEETFLLSRVNKRRAPGLGVDNVMTIYAQGPELHPLDPGKKARCLGLEKQLGGEGYLLQKTRVRLLAHTWWFTVACNSSSGLHGC